MTTLILNNILIKSLTAIGGIIGVTFHKINKDSCHAAGPAKASGIPWNNDWDGREPKATRHLFFIRHGQYNPKDEDKELTELGMHQSELTADRLVEMGLPFKLLTHSSLMRAVQTAMAIKMKIPTARLTPISESLCEGIPAISDPSSENIRSKEQRIKIDSVRIESAFKEFIYRAPPDQTEDSYEIIVCHANVIRYFICRALQFTPTAWLRLVLHHCSITWIAVHPDGRVEVKAIGDFGHIPYNEATYA